MKKGTEKELHNWNKLRRTGKGDDPDWQNIWDAADRYGRDFEPDVEVGLRRLKHKLASDEPATAKVVPISSARWLRSVAAVGVLLLVAWAGIFFLGDSTNTPAEWVEVQTIEGEKRELVLPDGSTITLNENSYLAYESDLNEAETRQVKLQGEAYFDIERRPEQAFIIATDRAEISVLGTSFNVRALAEETSTEVEVTSGRVAVRSLLRNEAVILETKEAVVLNENKLLEQKAPLLNRQSWRTGQITFRETPAAEALLILARFYGVDFDLEVNKLTNCTLTGNLENAPLEDALKIIESLTALQIKEVAQGIYRVSGHCD
jgi:ferric-dicitrate binding protein FerR (iron transport regulator)